MAFKNINCQGKPKREQKVDKNDVKKGQVRIIRKEAPVRGMGHLQGANYK